MRPVVILFLTVVIVSTFGFSGYALGEILDEFSPDKTDETYNGDERLDMNSDFKFVNLKNSIVEQIFLKNK
mgnify:CR=1 FL=1